MARKRKNNKLISTVIIFVILLVSGIITKTFYGDDIFTSVGLRGQVATDGKMLVEFIDVGQGDCTLITTSDTVILIDGGEVGEAQTVINYLKNKNISKIDCCIATHPHSDHIGSLSKVFDEFNVKNVIMMDLPESLLPTTTTYERFLESLSENEIDVLAAEYGETYSYGQLTIDILGPVDYYDNLNDMSIVSKISFGDTSVIVTGDAETPAENDMLATNDSDFNCDILKVGHHGSKTSTCDEWLDAVNPDYAVIMCGIDNDYGHPHKQLIKRLDKRGIDIFRTDLSGDIKFESDGKSIIPINIDEQ